MAYSVYLLFLFLAAAFGFGLACLFKASAKDAQCRECFLFKDFWHKKCRVKYDEYGIPNIQN
jgi:hypothetical protein